MGEPRYLPARIVLVNDVALRRSHQLGFGARHRLQRSLAVAALDRFLDGADGAAHLGAARLVDIGAPGNLARRFLGGSRIGHRLKSFGGNRSYFWSRISAPAAALSEQSCSRT